MCGLHGFITTNTRISRADDFIANGFTAGSLRGTDASGIASIDTSVGRFDTQKLPVPGSFFTQDKHARNLMLQAATNYQITMCHTRASTSGPSGMSAAHPFIVQDNERAIVGCHNGTLSGWSTKEDGKSFFVDSEWALNRIFKKGKEAFKEFNGSYCFTFWDSAEHTKLNIALNSERTLFVTMVEGGGMAYASEMGMLFWLLERNNIKTVGQIMKLGGGFWYTFDGDTAETLPKWTKEKLEEYTSTSSGSYTPSYAGNYSGYNYETNADKVDKLLKKISGSSSTRALIAMTQASAAAQGNDEEVIEGEIVSETLSGGVTTTHVMVTGTEIKAAKDLDVLGEEGSFIPGEYDENTGELGGYYQNSTTNTEFRAIIRNSEELHKLAHDYSIWTLRIIGIIDDGTELIAVCGKPSHMGVDREALDEDTLNTASVH